MFFTLPQLPFSPEKVSKLLSLDTIDIHYGRHHKNYIEKLNLLIKESRYENSTLENIVLESSGELYDVAAQAWNHTFYWSGLGNGLGNDNFSHKYQDHSGTYEELSEAINSSFGSVDQMKKDFANTAKNLFGSGWVWLVFNKKKNKLEIIETSNAHNPIKDGNIPLLVCDIWEHAYYIDFLNIRSKYIEEFLKLINWQFVNTNFKRKEIPNMSDLMRTDASSMSLGSFN